jgi:fumarate hydratase subunit alpha
MTSVAVVQSSDIADAVCSLYREINVNLREDVSQALEQAFQQEESDQAREVLRQILENRDISAKEELPLCQDTGLAVALVEIGNHVLVEGETVQQAVSRGVARAQRDHPLRASIVSDPLARENTGDNTPAITHLEQVEGEKLTISLMAKGGGAENMSRVFMLAPADGREGVVDSVVSAVKEAGANPCPPVIVGVGLGGDFEMAPMLAKRALFRSLGSSNEDPELDGLEEEMLEQINRLGIGPQGFGGRTTALDVLIESHPCHIASLPLAVNLVCHSHRHGRVELCGDIE